MYWGVILSFFAVIPLVLSIQGHSVAGIYAFVIIIRITMSATWAPLSTLMTQLFRPQSRYTSMSLAYGLGAAIWGGLSPVMASGLYAATGSIWSVVALFGALSIIAGLATLFSPQHGVLADKNDANGEAAAGTGAASPA